MSDPQPQRETVGAQYGGKWIAWNEDGLTIVASGETYDEAREASRAQGIPQPFLEFVPPSDAAFIGGL